MTYIIGLIVAIALGGLITFLSFVNFGSSFSENSEKGEAQRIISQSHEIEAAITAYHSLNGEIVLGDEGAGESLFQPLVDKKLLKSDLNDLDDEIYDWQFIDDDDDGSGIIQKQVQNADACKWINHIKHGSDLEATVLECSEPAALSCCIVSPSGG